MASLREALRGPDSLLFTFVSIPRIEVIEMAGNAGFGGVIVDLEHGPMGVGDLPMLSAAARGSGMFALARVRDGGGPEIGNVLDSGVDGVLVPHVSTASQAGDIVAAGRYPPAGERSLHPFVRGVRYGSEGDEARELADARTAVMVMVEGTEGLTNLEAISEVDGLDGIFVGPVDLSASLGMPGQPEHPKVVEAVHGIFRSLADRKVASGVYAPNPPAARRWLEAGVRLVALSSDTAMIQAAFTAVRAELDSGRDPS